MKKAIRYIVIAGCIALFLFLMLPFLVPPSSTEIDATVQQEQTAEPQIFTANPLTKILKRIARIWKRFPRHAPQAAIAMQSTPADQPLRQPKGLYAPNKDSADQATGELVPNEDFLQSPDGETNPSDEILQENDPNWALTRQEAPDRSATGMHEINVRDTPYNRYAKQERLARTAPVTRIEKPAEVPDSKLAKLFEPFTRLWTGKKQVSSPVVASAGNSSTPARAITSANKGLDRNTEKQVRSLPKAQMPDLSTPLIKSKSVPSGLPKYTLTDLINPTSTIRESARVLTQAAYETPGDFPVPDMPAGEFQQIQHEAGQQQVTDRLRQHLLALSEGAAPEDQIGKTVNCDIAKGLLTEEGICEPPYDENDLIAWHDANQQEFQNLTNIPMPPTLMAFVLGVADQNSLPKMQDSKRRKNSEDSRTKEIYRFMLEDTGNNCSSNRCYWVANSIQREKNISDTFTAAGVDFVGDPLHVYDQVKDKFTAKKLAELPPDATEEQRQAILQQPQDYAPPYVLYTEGQMKQLEQDMQQNPGKSMYVSTAADANALYENSWNYQAAPFFWGRHSQPFSMDTSESLDQRAHTLMTELAQDVNFMQGVMQDMQREAVQENIGGKSSATAKQIQKQLADEQALWEATQGMGKI